MAKYLNRFWDLGEQRVYYRLVIAFGLFFILPSLGFLSFAFKYEFFSDRQVYYFLLFVLLFSYLGFFLLRTLADKIRSISDDIEQVLSENYQGSIEVQASELSRIVSSFQQVLDRLEENDHRIKERGAQLRLLGEIVRYITTLNRDCNQGLLRGEVFKFVARELRQFMPVTVSFLALFDEKQQYLELLEVEAETVVYLKRGMNLSLKQPPFNLVFHEDKEIHQRAVTDNLQPQEASWFQELGINSCYLAPFRIQGVSGGLLFVGSDSKEGFSRPQQTVLQQVGDYLGLAIHNNLLLEQIDEHGRTLEALGELGSVLASSLFDLGRILEVVGTLIEQMVAIEAGAIYLWQEEMLMVKKVFGSLAPEVKLKNLSGDEGIYRYVISRGESVRVRDVSQNPHMASLIVGCGATKTRSVLCAPIVAGTEVVGAIHLWNKRHGTFTGHDEKVIKGVAASLATVVAGSRLQHLCRSSGADGAKVGG
jgi:GAF domain-containing protein